MPPRISRSSVQSSSKPSKGRSLGRNPKKAQKRALDAFSIASHEHADRVKVRRHRLGELEGVSHRKRPRDDEDEDDDDGEAGEPERRRQRRSGNDSNSLDEGSDSEGNTWTMGHVDDDDDSEIDSDEAFGESDEERFEGFTFRGSSSNQKSKKSRKPKRTEQMDEGDGEVDLDEDDSADEEEEDEDDLGEDAIDLATALDQYEESEEERRKEKKAKKKASTFDDSDEEPSEGEDIAADGASEFSSDEDEDEEDRRAQLKDLISSLPTEDERHAKTRKVEVHESVAPSEFGVARKVDLTSFKSKIADPEKKKALKLLQDDGKPSKRNDIARKLDAPLPKRQQDKLDRAAANTKANETLERWTDTIKHNRRAEHLHFPLQHPNAGKHMGENRLMPTTTSAPANDLESTIQSILQQSGLSNGKDDEEQIQKWEELQTNKLPLEEVMKRRAQLRKERELLFREEIRAKRIKKIKSKAYRRVHRKERERLLQRERDALKADGVDVSEDEREYNDRRRAEERMGAKHRESKWAKGMKATGRAAWDDDARAGVTEMARRNEELRRRIEGKTIHDEDDDRSDFSSDEEEEGEDLDEEDSNEILQSQLGRLKENPFSTGKSSKLGQMAFMQRAEETKRKQNDEVIEQMRRELAGEESNSEDQDENATKVGRRKFGPGGKTTVPAIQIDRSEFEERPGSDDEDNANSLVVGGEEDSANRLSNGTRNVNTTNAISTSSAKNSAGSQNPYLVKATKEKKTNTGPDLVVQAHDTIATLQEQPVTKSTPKSKSKGKSNDKEQASVDDFLQQRVTAADDDGWQTVLGNGDDDDDNDDIENEGVDLDVFLHNQQQLTAKAFAGDNVQAEFEAEKKAVVDEEKEKTVVNHLPGWGAWTGDGLTAKEKKNKGLRTVNKQAGIKPGNRKDAKLDRVIINEKRVKPNVKYMASQLPFPFETKEQYERSLRLPKGKEWTTKKTFQDATKPRVLVKQGVIRPMSKPMV